MAKCVFVREANINALSLEKLLNFFKLFHCRENLIIFSGGTSSPKLNGCIPFWISSVLLHKKEILLWTDLRRQFFLIWQQLMEIIIQANETDYWNLSSILFRYESTPWKSLKSCFEAEGLLFLGRGWGLLRQGATVSILNQTTNGSILFSCHLPSHVTEVENDIPTGNGIFFSQKEGVMIWIVVIPQILHIEIFIPKLIVSADENLGIWLDHEVGLLFFSSGHQVLAWYYILWGRTKKEGAIFETTK